MIKIIPIMALLILISCGKKEESQDVALEAQIVAALNLKDIPKAEALIDQGLANSPEESKLLYYKAQLYSLKANIDIYSLFPIVKMELFEFAITEWDSIDEYGDHMRSTSQDIVVGKASSESEKEIERKLAEIQSMSDDQITYNFKIDVKDHQENEGYDDYCYISGQLYSNIFPEGHFEWESNHIYGEGDVCKQLLDNYYTFLNKKDYLKSIAHTRYRKELKKKKNRKSSSRVVKALMSVYQSLNVIKNIPELDEYKFQQVSAALNLLKRAKVNNTEINKNAHKHQAMLAGYLVLGSLRNSIDLENVKDPTDIICKADAKKLVGYYPYFLTGIRHLHDAMMNTEFSKKNEKHFDKAKEALDQALEELSKEKIDEYIDDIEDYQEDYC